MNMPGYFLVTILRGISTAATAAGKSAAARAPATAAEKLGRIAAGAGEGVVIAGGLKD